MSVSVIGGGASVKQVQLVLGHASAVITLRIYAHLWPGEGSVNWKEAMELLRSAPNTPPLLLEIEHDDKVNPIEKMQPTFDKLETA